MATYIPIGYADMYYNKIGVNPERAEANGRKPTKGCKKEFHRDFTDYNIGTIGVCDLLHRESCPTAWG